MNYQSEKLDGWLSSLVETGKQIIGYELASSDQRRAAEQQQASGAIVEAQNRIATREQLYATNRAQLQSAIDSEKAKEYIFIAAALGIPAIVGMILLTRGKK